MASTPRWTCQWVREYYFHLNICKYMQLPAGRKLS